MLRAFKINALTADFQQHRPLGYVRKENDGVLASRPSWHEESEESWRTNILLCRDVLKTHGRAFRAAECAGLNSTGCAEH